MVPQCVISQSGRQGASQCLPSNAGPDEFFVLGPSSPAANYAVRRLKVVWLGLCNKQGLTEPQQWNVGAVGVGNNVNDAVWPEVALRVRPSKMRAHARQQVCHKQLS